MGAQISKFGQTVLESYVKDVSRDIERADLRARKKAGLHVKREMVKNLSAKGPSRDNKQFPGFKTRNLIRGIGMKGNTIAHGERRTIVGSRSPHSHLLEFGYESPKKSPKENRRPFFARTFAEESRVVEKILTERWL